MPDGQKLVPAIKLSLLKVLTINRLIICAAAFLSMKSGRATLFWDVEMPVFVLIM